MRLNGFKSLMPQRFRQKKRTYIYAVDLTPFRASIPRRLAGSPVVRRAAIGLAGYAALRYELAPQSMTAHSFTEFSTLAVGLPYGLAQWMKTSSPRLDHMVIDKSGFSGGDPQATRALAQNYLARGVCTPMLMMAAASGMYAIRFMGSLLFTTNDFLGGMAFANTASTVFQGSLFTFAAASITSFEASYKLYKHRWMVTTPPPKPSPKQADAPAGAVTSSTNYIRLSL